MPILLPFEAPLFGVGRLTITSAELALYLVLLAWGVGVAFGGVGSVLRRGRGLVWPEDLVGRAVVCWWRTWLVS